MTTTTDTSQVGELYLDSALPQRPYGHAAVMLLRPSTASGIPTTGVPHHISPEEPQKNPTCHRAPKDSQAVGATCSRDEFVKSFRRHIEPTYPLIMPGQLKEIMSSIYDTDKTSVPAKRKRREDAESKDVVALVVLALGASCRPGSGKRGWTYADEAHTLVGSLHSSAGSLNYIWANLLMALYDELFGSRQESMDFAANAGRALQQLLTSRFANLKGQEEGAIFTSEQNEFLFTSWIYLMMERYDLCTPTHMLLLIASVTVLSRKKIAGL
ncbi:hypothetical protein BR93DRAFT_989000 [Coniochaeta sp. PMI_546]|nr:hypothetical protein BR93DRAFT_989000 [Coniochaeta sp. PMI_546]